MFDQDNDLSVPVCWIMYGYCREKLLVNHCEFKGLKCVRLLLTVSALVKGAVSDNGKHFNMSTIPSIFYFAKYFSFHVLFVRTN